MVKDHLDINEKKGREENVLFNDTHSNGKRDPLLPFHYLIFYMHHSMHRMTILHQSVGWNEKYLNGLTNRDRSNNLLHSESMLHH